jgi:hypothetical protein
MDITGLTTGMQCAERAKVRGDAALQVTEEIKLATILSAL